MTEVRVGVAEATERQTDGHLTFNPFFVSKSSKNSGLLMNLNKGKKMSCSKLRFVEGFSMGKC